jgi:VanZ family protein
VTRAPTAAYALAYAAFVIYGSLVPLDLHPLPFDEALRRFAQTPFLTLGAASRADWIANGVLYFPLGALTAAAVIGWLPRLKALAMALAWVFCAALAVGVEFLQLFFPPRTVSLNDLLAEGIGAALGVLAAPRLGRWGGRLAQAVQALAAQASHAPRVLAGAWLAALVALALFPFDLVLSGAELAQRAASNNVAWLWVDDPRSGLLVLLRWGAEVAVVMPLGLAWAWQRPLSLPQAALRGLALGLAIEAAQFFLFSGVSQGVSVLSRVVGVVLGATWLRGAVRGGWPALRALVQRAAPWGLLPYAGALLLANGWFRSPLHGLAGAAATWQELRLLPFYYHYYTSEAVALVSLLSVVAMYLPVAAWVWARGGSAALAAGVVGLLALAVEGSKLLLGGMHPDPTNVLIAAAAAAVMVNAVRAIEQHASLPPAAASGDGRVDGHAGAGEPAPGGPAAAAAVSAGPLVPPGFAAAVVLAAAGWALTLPAVGPWVAGVIVGAAAAVWWRPWLAAALVPLALPMLDLASWTGRVAVDEFDLLLLACAAVVAARNPGGGTGRVGFGGDCALPDSRSSPTAASRRAIWAFWPFWPFWLLCISVGLGAARGLWPLPRLDTGGLADPMNGLAALAIGKGALLALLFAGTLQRLQAWGPRRDQALLAGLAGALAWTVGVVVWERLAFVQLLDFESVYRVTGPFSAMHRGGAYLECFLALASAFALTLVLRARRWPIRGAAAALLLATGYAVMVTYSRNGYVAWGVVLMLGLVLGLPRGAEASAAPSFWRRWGRWIPAAALLGLAAAVVLPIALTGFARERIERSVQDLQVRQAHWMDAIALRPEGWVNSLFGVGLGRFPEAHYWGSREPARAATLHLRRDGDRRFLSLGPGSPTYVEQWVDQPGAVPLTVTMTLRTREGTAAVGVTLCEKWLLTSARCETARVVAEGAPAEPGARPGSAGKVGAAPAGGPWLTGRAVLQGFEPAPGRPLKFTLMLPTAGAPVEVASVSVQTPDGGELLRNGDFASGLARWFWSTDVDPPWHIHSLPVALWFDLGWVGVVLWTLALGLAAVAALRRWQRGQVLAPAALVALAGLMTSGLVNTLVDTPRFLLLVLLLVWLCSQDDAATRPPRI